MYRQSHSIIIPPECDHQQVNSIGNTNLGQQYRQYPVHGNFYIIPTDSQKGLWGPKIYIHQDNVVPNQYKIPQRETPSRTCIWNTRQQEEEDTVVLTLISIGGRQQE